MYEELQTKVVFLDRDGVICERRDHPSGDERNYILNWGQFVWIPGSREAIVKLLENDYFVVVVSNQACVGKGYITRSEADGIMFGMWAEVDRAMGGHWEGEVHKHKAGKFHYYICPHYSEKYTCSCRKPNPGMIYRASGDWNLALQDAWMVGDELTDLKAGWLAGIRKLIQVGVKDSTQTRWYRNRLEGKELPDLATAADFILAYDRRTEC